MVLQVGGWARDLTTPHSEKASLLWNNNYNISKNLWNAFQLHSFNAGIKFLRVTMPDEIFTGILLFEPWISLICEWKNNKYTYYSFSLLIMYGSSYVFRNYIAILRERS
jgi:hypothetical protein